MCRHSYRRSKLYRTAITSHDSMEIQLQNESSKNTIRNMKNGIVCFFCGKINSFDEEFCVSCGTRIYRCPISQKPFKVGDKFVQCKECNAIFHSNHFDEWNKMSSNCPYCGRKIQVVSSGIIGENYFEAPPL